MRLRISRKKFPKNKAQLELSLDRPIEKDRNHHLGGKSFYFFDFDDNVAYLSTPIVLFHKETGREILLSSGEFARENRNVGKSGPYKNYFMEFNDETGSFRHFRDRNFNIFHRIVGKRQSFLHDIENALQMKDFAWKAPSWNCFYHATYNKRPISVITARGHHSTTIKQGIDLMVRDGHLPYSPNFLSIYPVSNEIIRKTELGDNDLNSNVPKLKRTAIRLSVEKALDKYGYSPFHRFGMSDDDPSNVELITEEMKELKRDYPEMSFFVIQTTEDGYIKNEVLQQRTRTKAKYNGPKPTQMDLFSLG